MFHDLAVRILRFTEVPIGLIEPETFLGVNETLQELHITNSHLEKFPKDAFSVLGNLKILTLDRHKISNVTKDIFFESAISNRLERLFMSNGNITDLEIETFQTLRKLKTLDLHGNQIALLKRNQFKNLRELEVLDLSHNRIGKLDSSKIYENMSL